ncbi:MAG: DNA-binding NarL/FixJ family response regulator [Cellvibrionaceae bacterium]|jgi:DNA-binding NarL/FixJ family response regulator
MIKILIADDHQVVRHGLKLALNLEEDMHVLAEASNGAELLHLLIEHTPDVVLLDWKMPRMDGLETARNIKLKNVNIKTLLLTGAPVEDSALDALDNGVDGFVHKNISPAALSHAIREVANGRRFLGAEISQALINRSRRPAESDKTVALSDREQEVLELMATSVTYHEIADKLMISETTVRTYVKRIFTKLGQPNRTQAVVEGLRQGLIMINPS